MITQTKDEIKQDLIRLIERFGEGWHDGIAIDASDIMLFGDLLEILEDLQPPARNEASSLGWQGLSDDDIKNIQRDFCQGQFNILSLINAIQEKLQELNHE